MFSYEFCEIFKNNFFAEHLRNIEKFLKYTFISFLIQLLRVMILFRTRSFI